jgi:diguanylate cyclase (GGDEF)-like protein/PAS domain S-box-containing protein
MQKVTPPPQTRSVDYTRGSPMSDPAKAAIINTMLSNTSQFRALLDLEGRLTELNQPALNFLSVERNALIGLPIWQGSWWLSQETRLEVTTLTEQAALGTFGQAEYQIEHQGRQVWIEFLLKPIRNPSGNVVMILAEGNDITRRKQLEQDLCESEAKYRSVLGAMSEGVLQIERDGTVSMCNAAAERILGQPKETILNHRLTITWQAISEEGQPLTINDTNTPTATTFRTGEAQKNWVMGMNKPSGELTWLLINTQPLTHEGETLPYAVVTTLTDITERKTLEDKLRQAALYDALTGLATRTLLMERLEQAVHRARRDSQARFAVLFLDLDNFKDVNDTLGHEAVDGLLKNVAKTLQDCVREADTVARLGGDEFVVLLEGVSSGEDITRFANRVLEQLQLEQRVGAKAVQVQASIGFVQGDIHTNAAILLKRADTAMYRAKAKGKGHYSAWGEAVPPASE